jgi:hypothetical protein
MAFLPMAKHLQPMLRGIAFLRARLEGARAA